ncbi:phage tail tube protein [Ketogulonicigenium vulgare]|uniref:phage tail tube protein n=1 Tax=Ketogulonicigenium vulgare TaxID=92945 RepID=UPI00235A34D8|nr:phage tail tube protein [Ketogulonicigenium vulgare]
MAAPIHEEYDELVVEFSEDDGTTWARNCVLMGVEVTRTTTSSEVETVKDCEDESQPNNLERRVQSVSVSCSGTGNWTRGGYDKFLKKFYAGDSVTLLARIGNLAAAAGEIEYEQGPIIISSLGQSRTKGSVVIASVEIQFATTPTVTMKVGP